MCHQQTAAPKYCKLWGMVNSDDQGVEAKVSISLPVAIDGAASNPESPIATKEHQIQRHEAHQYKAR